MNKPDVVGAVQFPASWYPLCRSQDLKQGEVIAVQFYGKRIAVFRTKNNFVGALDARCSHVGADLSKGWVDGELLTCPFHCWSYDVKGECKQIPCQDSIPPRVGQSAFHCSEHYGIVYAYWGRKPEFPFPQFAGIQHRIYSSPEMINFDAPYEMGPAISFDEQRLATVHRRQIFDRQTIALKSAYHFGINYKALFEPRSFYEKLLHGIGSQEIHASLDCWGGNILLLSNMGNPFKLIISFLPIDDNHSKVFVTTVLPQAHVGSMLSLPFKRFVVRILNKLAVKFVTQEMSALQGMDFKFMNVLPEVDNTMIKWHWYWKRLPRNSMGLGVVEKDPSTYVKKLGRDKCDEIALLD